MTTRQACHYCGTWECASCAHRQAYQDRSYTGVRLCRRCGGEMGVFRPVYHSSSGLAIDHADEGVERARRVAREVRAERGFTDDPKWRWPNLAGVATEALAAELRLRGGKIIEVPK